MPETSVHTIACPKCGEKMEVTLWDSVNSELNPEAAEKIADGSLFSCVCSKCGHTFSLFYPMVYTDAATSTFVQLTSDVDASIEQYAHLTAKLPLRPGHFRCTADPVRFREKVLILRAGLDDRAVEIVKCVAFLSLHERTPGMKRICFVHPRSGDDYLEILGERETVGKAPFDAGTYRRVLEDLEAHYPDFAGNSQAVIDENWAFNAMKILMEARAGRGESRPEGA
ncbi:CpXC domain-containing protein [Mesosutterella sp. AGMB02718]|uniref:CpXC domain-containing protein n=1 Tax=Mesosutterella faecium TaxID=2925194 RepID=A0ABT7IN25_9BURK|nr:CpXC domain-containing protein [Mesosutterella sp. AGMB02718]MDL2059779.1 CpXC domain-containing protein [Mesosutterella sp. AGMB02718]